MKKDTKQWLLRIEVEQSLAWTGTWNWGGLKIGTDH
jgi:hypothetical protein